MDFDARLESLKALYKAGKFKDALEPARALYDEVKSSFGVDDARSARACHQLAEVVYEIEGSEASLPLHLENLRVREKVLAADDPEISETLNVIGNCHMFADRFAEAAAAHGRALAMRRKANPASEKVAQVLNNIAHTRMRQHAFEDARPVLEEAASIFEKAGQPGVEGLAVALGNLGSVHHRLGNLEAAERTYRRSLEIKEKSMDPGHPSIARSYSNLGTILEELGKRKEAEELFGRSVTMLEERLGPDNPRLDVELTAMAFRFEDSGRKKEAKALLERTVASAEKRKGKDHLDVADRLISLAKFHLHAERTDDAAPVLERALAIATRAGDEGLNTRADALEGQAAIAQIKDDLAAAEALYQQSLEVREKVTNPLPQRLAMTLTEYGNVCLMQGRTAKAQTLFQRAWSILDGDALVSDGVLIHLCLQQAFTATSLGQAAAAEPWARRALALMVSTNDGPPTEMIDAVLDMLDNFNGKAPGFLGKLKKLATGARERPETWLTALERSIQEGRLDDAKKLLPRVEKAVAGAEPALAGRLEAAKKKL